MAYLRHSVSNVLHRVTGKVVSRCFFALFGPPE